MIRPLLTLALAALALGLSAPSPAAAQDEEAPRLDVRLAPWPEAGPWIVRWTLTSPVAQEVVADRRLLQLRVQAEGSRRRTVCRHPDPPRRVEETRTRAFEAGETHEEWVDLRELCWGRTLAALGARPAEIEVAYGFRGRGRGRFVARAEDERRPPHRVAGETLAWQPPADEGEGGEGEDEDAPVVQVSVRPVSTRSATPPARLTIRGRGGRVYLRDDLFSLRVRGPLGTVTCAVPRQPIVPIVDFYRSLRRPSRTSVDTARWCPEDTFAVPGVYEVTPIVELVYDAERYDFDAVTGTFEGEPTPFRVRGRGYVEQRVEDLRSVLEAEAAAAEEAAASEEDGAGGEA